MSGREREKSRSMIYSTNTIEKVVNFVLFTIPVPTIVRNCAVHDFATFVRICTLEYVVLRHLSEFLCYSL